MLCYRAPSTEMAANVWEGAGSLGELWSPQGHFPSPRARRPVRVPGTWRRECWGHLGTKIRKSDSAGACLTADWPWAWRKGHSLSLPTVQFPGGKCPSSPASPENKVTLIHDFFFFLECYTWHKCFLVMGLLNPSKALKQTTNNSIIPPVLRRGAERLNNGSKIIKLGSIQ